MGHDSTLNCDPGQNSTLNCDPRSWFHVELWPQVMFPRWIVTPGHNSTLNCDPGSWFHVEYWPRVMIPRWILAPGSEFHVELWPRVMIPRWIMTPGVLISRWIVTRGPGSHFNVKFWSRVIIQRGILTRGHNSNVEFWPVYISSNPWNCGLNKVSKFNGAIKIQQLGRVIIQRKIHWIVTPGRYSMGGSKFLSYTGPLCVHLLCRFVAGVCDGCGWPGGRRWLLPGTWSHLCFAVVCECPPWCSIVGTTVTVHQFFCIFTSLSACHVRNTSVKVQDRYQSLWFVLSIIDRGCHCILTIFRMPFKFLEGFNIVERP